MKTRTPRPDDMEAGGEGVARKHAACHILAFRHALLTPLAHTRLSIESSQSTLANGQIDGARVTTGCRIKKR